MPRSLFMPAVAAGVHASATGPTGRIGGAATFRAHSSEALLLRSKRRQGVVKSVAIVIPFPKAPSNGRVVEEAKLVGGLLRGIRKPIFCIHLRVPKARPGL